MKGIRKESLKRTKKLLQTFGGGGHAAAAGVRKRTNDVEKFRQEILERIVMMRKISGQDK